MNKKIINFLLIFLFISLIFQLFAGKKPAPITSDKPIVFVTSKNEYATGKIVELKIYNNTEKRLTFKNSCPNEPFTVLYTSLTEPVIVSHKTEMDCTKQTDPSTKDIVINPKSSTLIRYIYWSNALFNQLGEYKIVADFTLAGEKIRVESNEFNFVERGILGKTWVNFIYRPMYNALIFLIDVAPQKSLGIAIILLTLIIRLILFLPSQKALKAQKRMAEIQPKLNAIKEKYKDNQQKMAEETMKIWKENKVNPMGSCLPLIIQFPILIALFYVIQDGLNPDKATLLYSFLNTFDFTNIQTIFLNILPLTAKNIIVLPLIIGGLQFIQLKLTMVKNKTEKKKGAAMDQAQSVQNMMLYFMPVMIAVFTASLPAGVGLYWGTSTLFGIAQQIYVNKKN
jgi:YidC/Oxa1 family membrane protein insertase